MSEWFEKIVDDFCEEQAIEDRTSVETVKEKFYTYLTEQFMCSLLALLFIFLIEKGGGHIVEPHPSIHELPSKSNLVENQKKWEKFIAEREWEYTELSRLSKKCRVGYGGVAGHMSR